MENIHEFLTVGRIGLVLNIAGAVMIAFSFGKNLANAHQTDGKGHKVYLASFLHPIMFKLGVAVMIFGFILQLVGSGQR